MQPDTSATRLVLIRHGQSADNVAGRISGWTDSALTEVGVQQARRMARHVGERYQPRVVYSSTLQRARNTAAPLIELTGARLVIRPDLRELHFGVAEGLTHDEILVRHAAIWSQAQSDDDPEFGWPGGERRVDFHARVRDVFAEIVRGHPGETVAVVSHGGVLSSLLADVLEGNPGAWRRYQLHNCAVSEVAAHGTVITVLQWNQIEHLVDEATD